MKSEPRVCQRCHLPLQPEEQEHVDGFVFSKHTEADCISRLLDEITAMKSAESVEMDRLRKQLQEERKATPESVEEALKITGLIDRADKWVSSAEDRSCQLQQNESWHQWHVWLSLPDRTIHRSGILYQALTEALDEADDI